MSRSREPNPYAAPTPTESRWQGRQLRVTPLLTEATDFLTRHGRTIVAMVLVVWGPFELLGSLVEYGSDSGWLSFGMMLVHFAVDVFVVATVVAYTAMLIPPGEPGDGGESRSPFAEVSAVAAEDLRNDAGVPTMRSAMRHTRRIMLPFAWTYGLVTLLVLLGFIAMILPGLYLAVRLSMTDPVVVIQRREGLAAMRRSFELTSRAFWPLMGLCVLSIALTVSPWVMFAIATSLYGQLDHWLVSCLVNLCVDVLEVFPTVCFYLAYRELAKQVV